MKVFALTAGLAVAAAIASPAAAQPTVNPTATVTTLPASAFEQFRPQNAREMINRIEGFTFQSGDQGSTLLSGAGNVLIDGVRVSLDGRNLNNELNNIPARSVVEIQIVREGAGFDMQQFPLLANVIVKKGELSGTAEIEGSDNPQGRLGAQGTLDLQYRVADRTLNIGGDVGYAPGMQNSGQMQGIYRTDTTVTNPARVVTRSLQTSRANNRNYNFRAGFDGVIWGGRLRSDVSTAYLGNDNAGQSLNVVSGVVTPNQATTSKSRNQNFNFRYNRTLGQFEVDGRISHQENRNDTQTSGVSVFGAPTRSDTHRDTLTDTGNITFRFKGIAKWTIQGGANTVIVAEESTRRSPSGDDSSDVERVRSDVFTSAIWEFSPKFTFEGGLRYDLTTLTDNKPNPPAQREFPFVRPNFTITYKFKPLTTLSVTLDRQVANVNVGDFITSERLENGETTVVRGNANLVPETNWTAQIRFDHRFDRTGQFTITYDHIELIDILDSGPDGLGGERIDNIGDGTRDNINVTLNMPMDRFGLADANLRISADWRISQHTDPFTLVGRGFSGDAPSGYMISYNQEFLDNSLRTGFSILSGGKNTTYRRTETSFTQAEDIFTAFVEWRINADTTLRLDGRNLLTRTAFIERDVYSGCPTPTTTNPAPICGLPRAAGRPGVPTVHESRIQRAGPGYTLNLRRSF